MAKYLDFTGLKYFITKRIGKTDISKIGDGTCTGAISALNQSLKTMNENLKNLLTPNSQNQSFKMLGGSKAVNVTSGTFCKLFSCTEINSLLGTSDANGYNTVVFVANGDPHASYSIPSSRFGTADNSWYVIFNENISGMYRVNYMIFKF